MFLFSVKPFSEEPSHCRRRSTQPLPHKHTEFTQKYSHKLHINISALIRHFTIIILYIKRGSFLGFPHFLYTTSQETKQINTARVKCATRTRSLNTAEHFRRRRTRTLLYRHPYELGRQTRQQHVHTPISITCSSRTG